MHGYDIDARRRAGPSPRASASRPTSRAASRSSCEAPHDADRRDRGPSRREAPDPGLARPRRSRARCAAAAGRRRWPTASSGRQDLPIPRWLFGWGAAVVLVVSFVALAVAVAASRGCRARASARVAARAARRSTRWPARSASRCSCSSSTPGLAGTQTPTANLAPTFDLRAVLGRRAVAQRCCFGDVFRAFNPWRAVGRAARLVAGRVAGGPAAGAAALPRAARPLAGGARDPRLRLGRARLRRAATTRARSPCSRWPTPPSSSSGMSLYGVEAWSATATRSASTSGSSRGSRRCAGATRALRVRRPLQRADAPRPPCPGRSRCCASMIGTTTFDGFSQGTDLVATIAPRAAGRSSSTSASRRQTALQLAFTVGLLAVVRARRRCCTGSACGMRTVAAGHSPTSSRARFAHTLVPIALAYVVAHYFSLLAYQGQALGLPGLRPARATARTCSAPRSSTIDYGVDQRERHLVRAGRRARARPRRRPRARPRPRARRLRDAREATRSQYWMLAVMVAFTSLGLWLLSAANQRPSTPATGWRRSTSGPSIVAAPARGRAGATRQASGRQLVDREADALAPAAVDHDDGARVLEAVALRLGSRRPRHDAVQRRARSPSRKRIRPVMPLLEEEPPGALGRVVRRVDADGERPARRGRGRRARRGSAGRSAGRCPRSVV